MERHSLVLWLIILCFHDEVLDWVTHYPLRSSEFGLGFDPLILDGLLLGPEWARYLPLHLVLAENLLKHENQIVFLRTDTLHKHVSTETHILEIVDLIEILMSWGKFYLAFYNVFPADFYRI